MTLAETKRRAVRRALLRASGNLSRAAEGLAVSRQTLYNLTRAYGWLDAQGRIDPNRVRDGRKGREYWKPAALRDTPSNRAKRRERAARLPCKFPQRDMSLVRYGDSDRLAREALDAPWGI